VPAQLIINSIDCRACSKRINQHPPLMQSVAKKKKGKEKEKKNSCDTASVSG
jgi:hypothetical protein